MITVQVLGAEKLAKAFGRGSVKVSDLANAWQRIGLEIKKDAIVLAPVLTGKLVSTIRAGKAKGQATVRVGYANMEPYVKIIHYGGWASGSYGPHYIEGNRFMTDALHDNKYRATDEVEKEINRILERCGLK